MPPNPLALWGRVLAGFGGGVAGLHPAVSRRGPGGMHGEYDDGASDISSTSGFSAFGYRSGMITNKFKLYFM